MRGYKELNLNPISMNKIKTSVVTKIGLILMACMFIASITTILVFKKLISDERKEIAFKENYISRNKEKYNEFKQLGIEISKIQSGINKIQKVKEVSFKTSKIIESFNTYIPNEIIVKNLSFDNGKIQVECETTNYGSAIEMLANLQMSKEFFRVTISPINLGADGKYTFSININNEGE